ncbi:MAG: AbrB/MazE/SpoVT family DNA-binding domain-containing protein [Candidatus Bathyarchaeia archaeon]
MEVEEREVQQGGRVTIPKSIREKFGLVEGTVVKFRTRKGKIEIEPPTLLTDLLGLGKTGTPSEDPKKEAREYARSRFEREVE